MIALFTDFGFKGPYVGQMKALFADSPDKIPVIDLMHDAPRFDPKASAYLLAAITNYLPKDIIIVAVVDPGVGSDRKALALKADARWLVGPDNGLLEVVAFHARQSTWYEINAVYNNISASFHGRDVFAPAALKIAQQQPLEKFLTPVALKNITMDEDLAEIIYIDEFGNLMTGIRASVLTFNAKLSYKGCSLTRCATFSDIAKGEAFFYENSQGLIEIAVNSGSAKERFDAAISDRVVLSR